MEDGGDAFVAAEGCGEVRGRGEAAGEPYGLSRELKTKLRRLRSRNSWTARFEYFNPMQNESVGFGIIDA